MNYQKATKEELIAHLIEIKAECDTCKQELHQLEGDLVQVNKKLQESEAIKSHFISNICNEIINPFTSVIALSENILKVDKESWKNVISMVALIHSEVFHLDFQLKNIFAAAKLEAGEVSPEISKVDINSLLKNVIEAFKFDARHKHLQIVYESEIGNDDHNKYFNTDSEKLHLIISNLLSNAIKFSFDNSKVFIRAHKSFGKLIIELQDYGQGISRENENIIFDRFKRLDSGINSVNRGHGLGLSINKAMLDILEGTIAFTSKPNEGATFVVHIPESSEITRGFSSDSGELFFKDESF